MNTKKFKQNLNEVPKEFYAEVEKLLSKYNVKNVKVTRVQFMPVLEELDEKACKEAGREWHCDIIEGRPPYCRCLLKK